MVIRIPAGIDNASGEILLMTPLSNRFDDVLKVLVLPLKTFEDFMILKRIDEDSMMHLRIWCVP